jgi:hypothetical protein
VPEETLAVKLKLMNGAELDGSANGPDNTKWLKSFAERLYGDAKKQDEDDLLQGGYTTKKEEKKLTV